MIARERITNPRIQTRAPTKEKISARKAKGRPIKKPNGLHPSIDMRERIYGDIEKRFRFYATSKWSLWCGLISRGKMKFLFRFQMLKGRWEKNLMGQNYPREDQSNMLTSCMCSSSVDGYLCNWRSPAIIDWPKDDFQEFSCNTWQSSIDFVNITRNCFH